MECTSAGIRPCGPQLDSANETVNPLCHTNEFVCVWTVEYCIPLWATAAVVAPRRPCSPLRPRSSGSARRQQCVQPNCEHGLSQTHSNTHTSNQCHVLHVSRKLSWAQCAVSAVSLDGNGSGPSDKPFWLYFCLSINTKFKTHQAVLPKNRTTTEGCLLATN